MHRGHSGRSNGTRPAGCCPCPDSRRVPSMGCASRVVSRVRERAPATEQPKAPSDDKRWRIVETRMRRLGNQPDALIEALHSAQEAFGYLDDDALTLRRPEPRRCRRRTVYGVATFYSLLHAQAGRASTRASCAPGRRATSTGPAASWRRSATASGCGPADDRGRQGLAARRPAASGPAASPRRDRRRRGPGPGRRARARRAAGGAVTEPRRHAGRHAAPGAPPPAAPHGLVPAGPARASAHVCEAASCLSTAVAPASSTRSAERVTERGADRRRGQAGRLPRPVRRRPPGPGPRDRPAVRAASRPDDLDAVVEPLQAVGPAPTPAPQAAVLRPAGPDRDGELRAGRPREPRRLPSRAAATGRCGRR